MDLLVISSLLACEGNFCQLTFISVVTKNVVLATAVILVLIARGITFVYLGAKSTSLASFHSFDEVTPKVLIITTHSLAIVLDSTLATIMLCYLYRDRAALPRTNGVMTWLMIYYVNTGVVLASLSIAILITYLAIPDSLLYVGLTDIFAKVIANSFFGALNSRQLLRTRLVDPVVISTLAFASAPVAGSMVNDQLAHDQAEKGITVLQK
ncbi:hypothetical protein QCA50_007017 [Cerrena zonata]|uniref:DUF6534 domain-containing protein n=1 Tax=Cerrena zonata TaxID=2478898 RepID=A0AAW0GAF2_9APHY